MTAFPFDLPTDEDVILVNAKIQDKYLLRLALDTAATHTTIDRNVLYLSGYTLTESKGEFDVETSNGIIVVDQYLIDKLECIGIVEENFAV